MAPKPKNVPAPGYMTSKRAKVASHMAEDPIDAYNDAQVAATGEAVQDRYRMLDISGANGEVSCRMPAS